MSQAWTTASAGDPDSSRTTSLRLNGANQVHSTGGPGGGQGAARRPTATWSPSAVPGPTAPLDSGPGEVAFDPAAEAAVIADLRARVADGLSAATRSASLPLGSGQQRELAEQLLEQALDGHARGELAAGRPLPDALAEARWRRAVLDGLFGMGGLQGLLDDPSIENININGADHVWVRRAGNIREPVGPVAASDEELVELLRTLAARAGVQERRLDRGSPRLSLQLPDGSRLFAVMEVTKRPAVAIRRHRFPDATLTDLANAGMLDDGLTAFLTAAVLARRNILIAGGTSIGKTTLLRALASAIPPPERLITIEDTWELGLDADPARHPDVVAMQAREPNLDGAGEITQSQLVRDALRMSPDRVIIGEIRGPEIIPAANAMNQGNDGSLSTLHASSSAGVWTKLAVYGMQAQEHPSLEAVNLLVASAIHLAVYLDLTPGTHGRRVISSIREVVDADGRQIISNELYRPGPDRRARPAAPPTDQLLDALTTVGFDPIWLHAPEGWWPR